MILVFPEYLHILFCTIKDSKSRGQRKNGYEESFGLFDEKLWIYSLPQSTEKVSQKKLQQTSTN